MEGGKNKVTTKQQFEKLVELMEKHPDIGRGKPQFGCNKNKIKGLWEEFALELNSLGPPTRTAQEWGRVWVHYKANLKRKLSNNRANQLATGGGPSQEQSLNPLEESVAELTQIRRQVSPSGQAFGTQNIAPANDGEEMHEDAGTAASMPTETNASNEDHPTSSQRTHNPRKNRNVETERLELLTVQTETQKEVVKKIDRLERTLHKNMEINKKLLEIKQKKFEIYKKQALEAHELHELKVEVEKLKIAKLRGNSVD